MAAPPALTDSEPTRAPGSQRTGRRGSAYLVVNPRSGSYEARAFADALAQASDGLVVRTEVYQLTGEEVLREVVRAALERGFEAVVAVGGDGTVSAVAGAVVGTGIPMGIVPLGTGNALARELGIPLDASEALALILGDHAVRSIDVMESGDRYYVLNISAGFTPVVMRETEPEQKRRFGMLAYLWEGLKRLSGAQRHQYRLKLDDRAVTVRGSEVMVANAGRVGTTAIRWREDVRLDDEELAVCIVRARTAADYARLGLNLVRRRAGQDPSLRCLTARQSVEIDARPAAEVQGDGEPIGRTPLVLRLLPGAVDVIVPVPEEGSGGSTPANEGG